MSLQLKDNRIHLHDLSFRTAPDRVLFEGVSATFGHEKTGLVGRNGIGKSTLLKLIVGAEEPYSGRVELKCRLAYLPQDYQVSQDATVLEILGKEDLGVMERMGISHVDTARSMGSLSGGEQMKVILSRLLLHPADFLVLDEPTNNLDAPSRNMVYDLVSQWKGGVLAVSHDRTLLNAMDRIMELSEKGLKTYGGPYDFYAQEKQKETSAALQDIVDAKKRMKTVKNQATTVKARQEKRSKQGRKDALKGGMPKSAINLKKGQAEHTSAKLKKIHGERKAKASEELQEAQGRISKENRIEVDLTGTRVPNGKLVAEFKDVSFGYAPGVPVIQEFTESIYGPERVAVSGANGSGKTTLLKLLTGTLRPDKGTVRLGVDRVAYLDQRCSMLNPSKSILEIVQDMYGLSEYDGRRWLSYFLFEGKDAFKKIEVLSGGERMRAALACILAGETPPQLLLLDEPTNNLDLQSIEQIESALLNFKGALIVISHDQTFLENSGIQRNIQLLHPKEKQA